MADKVLPQRVSAASMRGEGCELLEGGGAAVLTSQGSWGGDVPTRRSISLSCLLPAGNFCSVPNQPRRLLSLPLGWQERLWGVHKLAKQDFGQARSSGGLGWRPQEDPKPLLGVPLNNPFPARDTGRAAGRSDRLQTEVCSTAL